MGVDFVCAFSLYHSFGKFPQVFLLYNFCAFALQLPIGMIADLLSQRYEDRNIAATLITMAGIFLTCIGAFLSPLVTGLGNALFHSGGGILTINEDDDNGFKGRGLGVFVAPGALGLALGMLYYGSDLYGTILAVVEVLLIGLGLALWLLHKREKVSLRFSLSDGIWTKIFICFLVVVIRSLCGMAIVFPWKNSDWRIIVSVFALALGKSAGGFFAARFGIRKTVILSLSLCFITYFFSGNMVMGLVSLFLFNMTMPITLYLLAKEMKGMPGFAFGILTFALFIGYLPVLYGYVRNAGPVPLGPIASLLSLVLLLVFERC